MSNETESTKTPLPFSRLLTLVFIVSAATFARAAEFDAARTTLAEEKTPESAAVFKYRLFPDDEVTKTEVDCDGVAIPFQATPWFDNPLNTSALLILVDASAGERGSPRNLTIDANKSAITGILALAKPNLQIGLYKFANDLVELSPLGAPLDKTRATLPNLAADGLGTRLYRSALEAVKKLAAAQADRKALLIFSDGKDEDTGFTLADLVAEAKKSNVIVIAVGCPESPQDIPSLGNLERLAGETTGFYGQTELVPARAGVLGQRKLVPKNPDKLVPRVVGSLVGGGQVLAALKNLNPAGKINFALITKGGQKLVKTLDRAAAAPATPAPSPTAAAASPTASPSSKGPAPVKKADNKLLVVAVVGALLAILGTLAMAFVLSSRRKKTVGHVPLPDFVQRGGDSGDRDPLLSGAVRDGSSPGRTLATLLIQDAEGSVLNITKTATRIGRRPDNDIVFANDSVSGHHAVLHIGRDGKFSITDTGSGNGILVNGQRVQQSGLSDGDVVELGEVRFRFNSA